MQTLRTSAFLAVLAVLTITPAAAEDQVIDATPCDFFCKLWRNVSRDAQVSSPTPIDNSARDAGPLPQATAGAEAPEPGKVVSQRGVVIVQTPAERAAIRQRKLALEKETTKNIAHGELLLRQITGEERSAADKSRLPANAAAVR